MSCIKLFISSVQSEFAIDCIKKNAFVSRKDMAEKCGISQDGIKWQLKQMQQQGLIRRVGPDKGGHWEIIEK